MPSGFDNFGGTLGGHDLGPQLEPALIDSCGGRLSDIHWFQTDWQRGGAATAHAIARLEAAADNPQREAVVKLPVGPREYKALTQLPNQLKAPAYQSNGAVPLPCIVFHGAELAGYDLAWVVMERLPGHPLSNNVNKKSIMALLDSAARFYVAAAAAWPLEPHPPEPNWEDLLQKARDAARENSIANEQRWRNAIKDVQKLLDKILPLWRARQCATWRHGDLHPGNAMQRPDGSPWGPADCILLDLAEMQTGHWVEDAVYLERLHWARAADFRGIKPVSLLAKAMRNHGLDPGDSYQDLANIRRVLLAACVPAFLHREGHPRYLEAALAVVEKTTPLLK